VPFCEAVVALADKLLLLPVLASRPFWELPPRAFAKSGIVPCAMGSFFHSSLSSMLCRACRVYTGLSFSPCACETHRSFLSQAYLTECRSAASASSWCFSHHQASPWAPYKACDLVVSVLCLPPFCMLHVVQRTYARLNTCVCCWVCGHTLQTAKLIQEALQILHKGANTDQTGRERDRGRLQCFSQIPSLGSARTCYCRTR
jgi:hypothetical protein